MGRTSRTALEAAARDLPELRAMGFVTGDAGKEKILSVWIKLINSFVEDETLIKQLNAEFGSSEIASSRPAKEKDDIHIMKKGEVLITSECAPQGC